MTDEQARPFYLSAACKTDTVFDHLNDAMFRGQKFVTNRQISNRMPAIHRAARAAAHAYSAFARTISNPPAPWPLDVQAPVASVSRQNVRLSVMLTNVATARRPRGVYYWYALTRIPTQALKAPVGTIRVNLGLPKPGTGC